jgi:hypothetical protein
VPATSAVSVLVIDWTTTGALPPIVTRPIRTGTVFLRAQTLKEISWISSENPDKKAVGAI